MLLLVLALTQAPRAPVDSFMGRGVSHALAVHRAATISGVRYALALDVTAADSATGTVTIQFHRSDAGDAILDWRGRRLGPVLVNGARLPDSAANGAHIRIPAALLSADNRVEASFVADIAPSGASIIRFRDQTDGATYLYTLLVPADANQLFPCFDQPDLKARVSFTLTAPREWTVVANGSETSQDSSAAGLTHHFTETRPLSTYLIAFAAGPWHKAQLTRDGRTITGYVRRSRAREADLDTLLDLNARALGWMERYFARGYPFEKFAFVLAPAFPFGGMEHPGAVFFNEDRFIFRERPTLPQRLGRFSTILHEVAHMWFGDLVTMRWFDDLWLKEGFATYMAAKALADLDTASGAWKTFYLANKPAAYGVDQTAGTTPLWQSLGNLDQAKSNYGAIVYNKAPGVLKQLNFLVGDAAFRAGLRAFLTAHAYGNATWQDLLGAVGHAAGRDLTDFGRNFMLRPGMPEVAQLLTVRGGRITRLALVQHPVRSLSGSGPWPERVEVVLWYPHAPARRLPVTLAAETTVVAAARGLRAPAFVYANAGDYGYMLTRLDSASLADLEAHGLTRVADPFLRAMLWGALWDEVRATRLAPEAYVRLALRELPRERDEQIVPRVLARMRRAVTAYLSDGARNRLADDVDSTLWREARDPSLAYGVRKAWLDAWIDLAALPQAIARLDSLLDGTLAPRDPLGQPTRWDMVQRLVTLGAGGASERLRAQMDRDTTPDGRRRTFVIGAAWPLENVKQDYFTRYFSDRLLNEDWASASLGAFNALEHETMTLRFLRPALDSLPWIQANRRIFYLGSWLAAFMGGHTTLAALEVVQDFLAAHPGLAEDLRRKVLENADELERTVAIHRRWG